MYDIIWKFLVIYIAFKDFFEVFPQGKLVLNALIYFKKRGSYFYNFYFVKRSNIIAQQDNNVMAAIPIF